MNDDMQTSIENELSFFYSNEKEEIEAVIVTLQSLLSSGKINENIVTTLDSCEREIGLLRFKYTNRLFKLYKLSHRFTE